VANTFRLQLRLSRQLGHLIGHCPDANKIVNRAARSLGRTVSLWW
jgi:hypothetical protein